MRKKKNQRQARKNSLHVIEAVEQWIHKLGGHLEEDGKFLFQQVVEMLVIIRSHLKVLFDLGERGKNSTSISLDISEWNLQKD